MGKRKLDFVVIGAPKSATRTLFKLANQHPEIYIPESKEAPFFNEKKSFDKGWSWYLNTYFKSVLNESNFKIGTVTPQYMSGNEQTSLKKIVSRMFKQCPDAKIIAILRHPVERSFSHHKMYFRQGYTKETFEESVKRLTVSKNKLSLESVDHSNRFLAVSQYGEILSFYYDKFPKENILVIFMDELEKNPQKVLKKFFKFIDVQQNFVPEGLGEKFHKGGSKPKTRILTPGFFKNIPGFEKLWRNAVPHKLRKKIYRDVNNWNMVTDDISISSNDITYKKLVNFLKPDIKKLEKLVDRQVPWTDWKK